VKKIMLLKHTVVDIRVEGDLRASDRLGEIGADVV